MIIIKNICIKIHNNISRKLVEQFQWDPTTTCCTANAYCNIYHDTTLATIGDSDDRSTAINFLTEYEPDRSAGNYYFYLFIRLYRDSNDHNEWKWISDNSYLNPSVVGNNIATADADEDCRDCSIDSDIPKQIYAAPCELKHELFLYDRPHVVLEDEKYIGVSYSSGSDNSSEANSYRNDTFGTELATISSSNDNDMVINILSQIYNSNGDCNMDVAWIGLGNVISVDNFRWEDGRDSSVTGYTNRTSGVVITVSDRCVEFGSGGCSGGDEWISVPCDSTSNTFVCNRANAFNFLEYKDYIGVEAVNYDLTYDEANCMCEIEFGTTLASIHSSSDLDDILDIPIQMEYVVPSGTLTWGWIGLTDSIIEGTFLWKGNTVFDSSTSYIEVV